MEPTWVLAVCCLLGRLSLIQQVYGLLCCHADIVWAWHACALQQEHVHPSQQCVKGITAPLCQCWAVMISNDPLGMACCACMTTQGIER